MEYRYRGIDHRKLPPVTQPPRPPSSNFTFSGDHLYQGYDTPPLEAPSHRLLNEHYRHLTNSKEAIWLEIEKERIREEIIMEEIVRRRRMLEYEVRREFMYERNMTLQERGGTFFFSAPQSTRRIDSAPQSTRRIDPMHFPDPIRHHMIEGSSHRETIGQSLEEGIIVSSALKPEFSSLERAPERTDEPIISEIKSESETSKVGDRITLMEKAEANVAGTKRRTVIQPTAVSSPSLSAVSTPNKKMKQDWVCTLCEVSATSEQGLNDHLQGKKHKAKEAGLTRTGNSFSIGWSPSPIKKLDGHDTTPAAYKTLGSRSSLETATNSEDIPSSVKQLASEDTNEGAFGITNNALDDEENSFTFWCEMCQVGAYTVDVMEAHKNGKKHLARLLKCSPNTPKHKAEEVNLPTS